MKKIFLFLTFMLSITLAKAQYTKVNVINNTSRTDMYVSFTGNNGTGVPCSITNTTSPTGPLAPSTTYSFTTTSVSWSGSGTVIGFVGFNFDIIPTFGPMDPGPIVGLCLGTIPPSPFVYIFTSGARYNLYFSFPAPGEITVEIR